MYINVYSWSLIYNIYICHVWSGYCCDHHLSVCWQYNYGCIFVSFGQ